MRLSENNTPNRFKDYRKEAHTTWFSWQFSWPKEGVRTAGLILFVSAGAFLFWALLVLVGNDGLIDILPQFLSST